MRCVDTQMWAASGQALRSMKGHPCNDAGFVFATWGHHVAQKSNSASRNWSLDPDYSAPIVSSEMEGEPLLPFDLSGLLQSRQILWNPLPRTPPAVLETRTKPKCSLLGSWYKRGSFMVTEMFDVFSLQQMRFVNTENQEFPTFSHLRPLFKRNL